MGKVVGAFSHYHYQLVAPLVGCLCLEGTKGKQPSWGENNNCGSQEEPAHFEKQSEQATCWKTKGTHSVLGKHRQTTPMWIEYHRNHDWINTWSNI